MLDKISPDIIYVILKYISPKDRYELRRVSKYLYHNGWLDDEYEYATCSNLTHSNDNEPLECKCYEQNHLNCIRYLPGNPSEKLLKSINYCSPVIYDYYKRKGKLELSGVFNDIIYTSNCKALELIADNYELIGRLSFRMETIIMSSSVEFIHMMIKLAYNGDTEKAQEDFGYELSLRGIEL